MRLFYEITHKNHTWKVTNVEMYCDIRNDVNTLYTTEKKIYNDSYFIVMMIKRVNDFTKINFLHITPIGITYYNTK